MLEAVLLTKIIQKRKRYVKYVLYICVVAQIPKGVSGSKLW